MEEDALRQMRAIEDRHWWYRGRRAILSNVLRELNLPMQARILEAGCGTGGNLRMLAGFGQVSAVEPHPYCLECARSIGIADIRPGRLPDAIPFERGSFDLVAALDVLEHVVNDLGSLIALREMLKPGGWIVFTVPAFMFLWGEHDERNHHYRRYRKPSAVRLAEAAGFGEIHCQYFNTLLFPPIVAFRLMKKHLRLRQADDDALPPSVLNQIFLRIFRVEKEVMRLLDFPFGISLVASARKL
ncbi:MAG: methyltransferase domain-containing protein [Stellaceae bacterium]